ncbi:Maf family protein [Ketobacter sp.]|uniref:Maf family protein n=1 Tax=Ketobacter sp. TaxID=2083498 RepID=UPI000F28FD8A|nr:Maf family protein [Ketobacter sp.]RLT94163.1 MAG: septum formation inhibitor Maf [Ketobacter sp.]
MAVDWVYLASASPRRRELLQQIGVRFTVMSAAVDEAVLAGESPLDYVCRLAQAKADAVLSRVEMEGQLLRPVLGADTTVVLGERILGKPADEADAVAMLLALSGQTHQVMTAVALVSDGADCPATQLAYSVTEVQFRSIDEAEARQYWRTGEPADKAGAYGIQGLGAVFVENLSGSYSGVVGLPLYETANLLKQAGVSLWRTPETVSHE